MLVHAWLSSNINPGEVLTPFMDNKILLMAVLMLLGLVMYLLGAGWAALFEISVCTGFVTVIFISAVTMTNHTREDQNEIYGQNKDGWLLPMMIGTGMLLLAVFAAVHFRLPYPTGAVAQETLSGELWGNHRDLIAALIAALIAGTFAVVVLFREEDDK